MTYPGTQNKVSFRDGPQLDPFGRLRISAQNILLSSQLNYGTRLAVWDELTSGTGNAAHSPLISGIAMTVAAPGDEVIRQTKRYYLYRAGQGQTLLATAARMHNETGVIKEVGYNDANNGVFFQSDGVNGEYSWVLRSSTSGSPDDTNRAEQAAWNLDTLDGSGGESNPSKLGPIDFTNEHIYTTDLEWLGAGRVRVGFGLGGATVYCHEFDNSGQNPTVYMSTGSLPARYRIFGGAGTTTGRMDQTCTSILREGGQQEKGDLISFGSPFTPAPTIDNIERSILSVRLSATHRRAFLSLREAKFTPLANNRYQFRLLLNPTTGAPIDPWVAAGEAAEYSLNQQTITASTGRELGRGDIDATISSRLPTIIDPDNELGVASNIAGDPDTLVLSAISDAPGGAAFEAAMQLLEFL